MSGKGKTRKGTKAYGHVNHVLARRRKPARIARRRALSPYEKRCT